MKQHGSVEWLKGVWYLLHYLRDRRELHLLPHDMITVNLTNPDPDFRPGLELRIIWFRDKKPYRFSQIISHWEMIGHTYRMFDGRDFFLEQFIRNANRQYGEYFEED